MKSFCLHPFCGGGIIFLNGQVVAVLFFLQNFVNSETFSGFLGYIKV